jgi:hypothetical protein
LIGHIHKHTVYGLDESTAPLIIAPGSHDRDTHGQEEPKGFVIAECHQDGRLDWRFVENTNARVFKRINTEGWDVQQYESNYPMLQAFPEGSFIELQGKSDDIIKAMLPKLMDDVPHVRFTYDIETDWTATQRELEEEDIGDADVIHITPANIGELLVERLMTRQEGVDDATRDAVLATVQEVLTWNEG